MGAHALLSGTIRARHGCWDLTHCDQSQDFAQIQWCDDIVHELKSSPKHGGAIASIAAGLSVCDEKRRKRNQEITRCLYQLANCIQSPFLFRLLCPFIKDVDQVVTEHVRAFNRDKSRPEQTIYDWRHYISVAQRKPGALRNGAPFMDLPDSFRQLRTRLLKRPGGNREMVDILALVLLHDEQQVERAVTKAL